MQTTKIIYETGATSHAVNDLILFTDTTAKLAKMRDITYTDRLSNTINDYNMFYQFYYTLFSEAKSLYRIETGLCYLITRSPKLKEKCRNEFAQIYKDRFEIWKQENNIKP